jgi:hypothetical protein
MLTENILTDPSDAELAAAVQENLYALFRAMTTLPGSELVEGEKPSAPNQTRCQAVDCQDGERTGQ